MTVETTGLDELIAGLQALSDGLPDTQTAIVADAETILLTEAASYPPQRPTKYVRTGNYGRSMFATQPETSGSVTTGLVDDPVPYSIYLRGVPDGSYRQAWMHVGFWTPLVDIIAAKTPEIEDRAQAAIDNLIADAGLA